MGLYRALAALIIGALLVLGPTFAAAQTGGGAGSEVLVATVDGAIGPVTANYLDDIVDRAEEGGYAAVVVRLDTPGGLDTSMRDIVQRFLVSEVPIVVYVSPDGARAASAGAIITFAAHVAAMAPGTAIGAATPVNLEGGDVERKIVNDAAAFARSIAELRQRNVEFAVDTVRTARSASADEAVSVGAVDLVAPSLDDLLRRIDGTEVTLGSDQRTVTLATAGATTETVDLNLLQRIQQVLANPELAFLFLSIGTLGLIYELASPGVGAGGAVGGIMLVLAMFGLTVLPVDAAGLVLLALAIALFVAELFAPGIGVAAAGGALALALSGVFLFRGTPGLDVSLAVVAPVAVVAGGSAVLAGRLALASRHEPSTTTGTGRLVGRVLTVERADGRRGQARLDGTWWNLRGGDAALESGMRVRVTAVEGLDLVVDAAPVDTARPTPVPGEHPAPAQHPVTSPEQGAP